MTRECSQDFTLLKDYIADYSISCNLEQEAYLQSAKQMHKVYFSLVNWHVEYQHQIDFFSGEYTSNSDILIRLSETVSDIGSSKFNWLNGSYKASRVMLRSAIENFVRAMSSIDDEEQLKETSVYSLFDNARDSKIFNSSSIVKKSYTTLHSKYKELCKDTHTASAKNMENITSLVDYPKYIESKSTSTRDVFISIVKDILAILCISFNELYHKMHHGNKENIINSLPIAIRPAVLAP
jgi:hypothetical protein